MLFAVGIGLIALTVAMILGARPKMDEDSAPYLKVWPVGQAYALVAMTSAVAGVTTILTHWPF